MLLLLVFAIVAVVSFTVYDGMVDNGFFTLLNASAPMQPGFDRAFTAMDWMGGLLFIGASISAIIGAILVRSHPAFFFLSIIILILEVIIGVVFSNIWYNIITNANLAGALAQFVVIDWFMSYLPLISLVISLVIAVVMYAVNPYGQ